MSDLLLPAASQLFEWARAWVENETVLRECRSEDVTPEERKALAMLRELGVINWDRG